jgi:hypothetical protein
LGLSPRRRQLPSAQFSPDQVANLAFWYRAGHPLNTATGGGASARPEKTTPASHLVCRRDRVDDVVSMAGALPSAAPFNYGQIGAAGTAGVTTDQAASDQLKLID